jgi:tight adherence protein C
MEYAILAFLICFLLASSALLLVFNRAKLGNRLTSVLGSERKDKLDAPTKAERLNDSIRAFAGAVQKAVPKGENEVSLVRRRLILAGKRQHWHVHMFYASKAALAVALVLLATITGAYEWQPFVVFAIAIALGYLLADYWLSHATKGRQDDIKFGLPDTLDLLVVCLEAGLSLDLAVLRTSDELASSHPAVSDELKLVMLEVKAGKNRADSWKALVERTDTDETRALVSIFLQADQLGTSVSKTLRIHGDTMRTRRTQRLEELAAKTSVKLVFPLVFCIFPSLFVVMLGSAMLQITSSLDGKH